jgi:hypothetical protein
MGAGSGRRCEDDRRRFSEAALPVVRRLLELGVLERRG